MLKSIAKYLLSVIGAAFIGLLVLVLVTTPLRMMFKTTGEYILSSVCCVLASMVALFFFTMKCGYDDNAPEKPLLNPPAALQMVAAVAAYILLTVLFRYYTGAATNVANLAHVLGGIPSTVDISRMAAEHGGWMFLSLVIQALPFIPAMLVGYVAGGKRRQRERASLHGKGT